MNPPTKAIPWKDRWNVPTLNDLVKSIAESHRGHFQRSIEEVSKFEKARWAVRWHGPSWRWSIRVALGDPEDETTPTVCYLVPNPERPVYAIPLRDETIRTLPKKRLTKYVRDGIRSAKWSVEVFWAHYTPALDHEANMVFDLIKRTYNHLAAEPKPPAHS